MRNKLNKVLEMKSRTEQIVLLLRALIRYQHRELGTEEMLRIKQHIDICGSCDCVLVQLSEFDSVAGSAIQAKQKVVLRFFLHPALAYGIVLLLLYPAYLGLIDHRRAARQINDGTGSAMDFDLGQGSATRSASSGEQIVVPLSSDERFFILTFFLPVRRNHRYEMAIRNEQGILIDSKDIHSRDSVGNFSIVANGSLFPNGIYKLTVKEVEPANGVIKNEYNFHFRIERNQESGA